MSLWFLSYQDMQFNAIVLGEYFMDYRSWLVGTVALAVLGVKSYVAWEDWKKVSGSSAENVGSQFSIKPVAENKDLRRSVEKGTGKIEEPCSAYKFWADSEERKGLSGPLAYNIKAPASLRRRAEYVKFLDAYWSSIDLQLAKKQPQTVGDVFDNIKTAYVVASAQYGKSFRTIGVETRLLIGSVELSSRDLQNGSAVYNAAVQEAIVGKDYLGDSNTFDVGVRFIAGTSNYLEQSVISHARAGLSVDSSSIKLTILPKQDFDYSSHALRRVLTCTLK